MRSKATPYEVRCNRCDVTFPIETRTCIHCGGAMSSVASDETVPVFEFGSTFDDHVVSDGESLAASPMDSIRPPRPQEQPLEEQDVDSDAPSIGRSILGSMGSLIWIALLIAFSLSGRLCGE